MTDKRDFIDLRDARTDALLPSRKHKDVHIAVALGPDTAQSLAGQAMAVTIGNLLPRIFNNLTFMGFDVDLIPNLSLCGQESLMAEVAHLCTNANPAVNLFSNNSGVKIDCLLGIGTDSYSVGGHRAPDVVIEADGWVCLINPHSTVRLKHESSNLLGPIFAACLGMAESLKIIEGFSPASRIHNGRLSLLDYKAGVSLPKLLDHNNQWPNSIDIGNILMVGAGAVGSSVAYLLRLIECTFNLDIVDEDTVDETNLSKSPLFFVDQLNQNKASVVATLLNDGVRRIARGHEMRYSDFSERFLKNRPPNALDIVLPLADIVEENGQVAENARYLVQQAYFPLMIHGTTCLDWGINVHRHIPFVDDCIMCRFPPEQFNARFTCGEEVTAGEKANSNAHFALPFQPLMAAIGVVGELVKLQLDDYPYGPNKVHLVSYGSPMHIVKGNHLPEKHCLCNRKEVAIHKKWNGKTKYDHLVPD